MIVSALAVAGLMMAGAHGSGAPAVGQGEPLFRFEQTPGPNAVGLRVVEQYDHSRTFRHQTDERGQPFKGELARPLQTLMWYPASRSAAAPVTKPMTVGDYVNLWASETAFDRPRMPAMAKEWLAGMGPTLTMPLWAVRDAAPEPQHFPVLIYAPGSSGVAWENADLCEYLASHGYIVLATPSLGRDTRDMTGDLDGANTQARDIAFLIAYAHSLNTADPSAIGIIGHSWGGLAGLFAAARDNRIGALVSLDGSMRYFPSVVEQAGDVHPEQMTLPMLAFLQRNLSLEYRDRVGSASDKVAANVFNAWTHGDLLTVHMMGLAHAMFASRSQRNEDKWWEHLHASPMLQGDYDRNDAIVAYAWMARYTLAFLDAYLKHDEAAAAFLARTPAQQGVPTHVMAVEYRKAAGLPISVGSFRAEVARKGLQSAPDVYTSFTQRAAGFTLRETELNAWANELLTDNRAADALILLELNARIHPESSAAHEKLGDARASSGRRDIAVVSYARAVQLNPTNAGARRKLQTMSGALGR